MRSFLPVLVLLLAAPAATAAPSLIALAKVAPDAADLSGRHAVLENGVPGDRLGGFGSAITYAGGDTFLALPDRGPNADKWNKAVDDTSSYVPRLLTFDMQLKPAAGGLPFDLTPKLTGTTLFYSTTPLVYGTAPAPNGNGPQHFYFTGRSDAFDPARTSADPADARLDSEGLRLARDGRSVFVSDEYGPHLYRFDRSTGERLAVITLPAGLAVAHPGQAGDAETKANTSGRVANKGMEGLAITPDGSHLIGAMQSPLIQDGGVAAGTTRIVMIDLKTGEIRQYAYPLDAVGTADKPKYADISEIIAVNDHQFLVDEHDGKGLGNGKVAQMKRLYLIDLDGAAEVSGISGADALAARAVGKTLFLDIVAAFTARGLPAGDIPSKIEGLAFGRDLTVGGKTQHTLWISTDNDFLLKDEKTGTPTPTDIMVFAFDPADLPGYQPQILDGR